MSNELKKMAVDNRIGNTGSTLDGLLELVSERTFDADVRTQQTSSLRESNVLSGHLAGVDEEGRILFLPEGEEEVFPVSLAVSSTDDELILAARAGHRALALRTSGPLPRWVLLGILRERVSSDARDNTSGIRVEIDGETVRLSAESRIELTCGKSRIVLQRNGKIEISGSYLLSRSRGPVKVKGATVEIN